MNRPFGATVPATRRNGVSRARSGTDEFSVREVLGDGTSVWLSHVPAFSAVALIVYAPLLAVTFLPGILGFASLAIFVAGELVLAGLIEAAATKAVSENERGLRAEFPELLSAAFRRAPAVLALRVGILIGAAGRGFMLLLPGVRYLCAAYVAVPALMNEDASTGQALRETRELTEGAFVRIFEICCATWTAALLVNLVARFPLPSRMGDTTLAIVYLCARALERSWAATTTAMAYRQLCDRRDGMEPG
jgi:hypothetical protein